MTPVEFNSAGVVLFGPRRGWQTKLADALGVDRATVSRYSRGISSIPAPVVRLLLCWLGAKAKGENIFE